MTHLQKKISTEDLFGVTKLQHMKISHAVTIVIVRLCILLALNKTFDFETKALIDQPPLILLTICLK